MRKLFIGWAKNKNGQYIFWHTQSRAIKAPRNAISSITLKRALKRAFQGAKNTPIQQILRNFFLLKPTIMNNRRKHAAGLRRLTNN